ncbi:MAG: DUF47 family protein [Burkholderiales bacterium]|nr:DUF47 family protein [Burkholderiales bacterium]
MLRKIIKSIIPSKGSIFFDLFEEASKNAYQSSQILVDILNANGVNELSQACANGRILKQKSNDVHKRVLQALNKMFITPIDRGDIQELSGVFNKLTKRIVKISTKLDIYKIDAKTDDCMIKSANTLLIITKILAECMAGLKSGDNQKIELAVAKISDLEEHGIDDFRHAINEIYSGKFDTLTILKLKEIYKSIDGAIELCINASDLTMQISLEGI